MTETEEEIWASPDTGALPGDPGTGTSPDTGTLPGPCVPMISKAKLAGLFVTLSCCQHQDAVPTRDKQAESEARSAWTLKSTLSGSRWRSPRPEQGFRLEWE